MIRANKALKRKLSESQKSAKKTPSEILKLTRRRTPSKDIDSKRKNKSVTRKSIDSYKVDKKIMRYWIERPANGEETDKETDVDNEAQSEEVGEEDKESVWLSYLKMLLTKCLKTRKKKSLKTLLKTRMKMSVSRIHPIIIFDLK